MSFDELKLKYKFMQDMSPKQVQQMLMFFTMLLLDLSMGDRDEKRKFEIFIDDLKCAIPHRQ